MSNFRFKLFFIVTSIFFYISPGHAKNTQKNDVGVYQLLNFQEVSYIPRIYLPDDKIIGFNRTYGFSNDSKLFSLFQIYEDDLATIRVWDIKSKALKHKKVIDNYADAGGGSYVSLEFSPSNQLISISGIVGHPFMTWKFADDNEVALSCQGYMGGYIQEASNDDQYYTVKTVDNEYSLCQPGIEGELVNYKNWMPEAWWGRNTQTLYDGKILTLYNYHLASEEPHRPKEKPPAGIMEWIDLWDLNFTSTANRLISQLDRKNKAFFLIETFDNKVIIRQWDYARKKRLTPVEFTGIQAEKVYFADNYLLLRNHKQFSLIKRTDAGLKLAWSKNLSSIYEGLAQVFPPGSLYRDDHKYFDPYSIAFSLDEKQIIFRNTAYRSRDEDKLFSPVVLVDVAGGAVKKYPAIALDSSVTVDPQARYFFKDDYGCDTEKTTLYSLVDYSDSKDIEGEVMTVSPDGDVLATCHENELSFLVNNGQ